MKDRNKSRKVYRCSHCDCWHISTWQNRWTEPVEARWTGPVEVGRPPHRCRQRPLGGAGMSMEWFRWYHGTVSNPKLALIAKKAGQSRADKIVW